MDNCSKFSPKKPYPLMHPDRGTCKGCNYGKNGKWGENCPLKTIKEPPEPKERIENRELILSYIPAVMQDEEGNLVFPSPIVGSKTLTNAEIEQAINRFPSPIVGSKTEQDAIHELEQQ